MLRLPRRALTLAALATVVSGTVITQASTPVAAAGVTIASLPTDNPANWTPNILNGQVNTIWQFGNKVVVGGTFTQVADSDRNGGTVYNRAYLVAFDATTGLIDPAFDPVLSSDVEVVIPAADGTTMYIGGDFNTIDGTNRRKVARLNISDGSLVTTFNANGVNARVRDLRLVGSDLYMAGLFTTVGGQARTYLASLNAANGAVTTKLNLTLSGLHNGGVGKVIKIDTTPNGGRLLIEGNFTSINGQPRTQVALIDIASTPATLSPWQTNFFTSTCSSSFDSYLRDLDISEDGTFAVFTTTGAYRANTSCDTVSRFELTNESAGLNPTWINYTGGDTSYAAEIHDGVVYLGGHMRWVNNPYSADAHGAGGVTRTGMAALDTATGLPYSWNPTRERGVGLFDYHVTEQGVWAGSDTERWNNEQRLRLAFFPWTGGKNVPANDIGVLPNDIFQLGRTSGTTGNVDQTVLYRINAGGGTLTSVDDGPDWASDTSSTSIYRNTGSSTSTAPSSLATPQNDATVPKSDFDRPPAALWTTERYDPSGGNEMQWSFPVTSGTPITVRLYFGNRCTCTNDLGERVFDVTLDNQLVLDNFDISGAVGHDIGTMRSFDIVSDGSVNINFIHGVENPLINGIEIIRRDIAPSGTIGTQDDVVRRVWDGVSAPTVNSTTAGSAPWRRVRGAFMVNSTLYTFHLDGTIMTRQLDGTTFGPGTAIDMWSTDMMADMATMTGIFFDPATSRVYYTLSGNSSLYYREFVPESGIPHAQRKTTGGAVAALSPSRVNGMFLGGDGNLYFADSASGNLLRMAWVNGAPSGTTSVADNTVDWRARALFRSSGAQPNVLPTAAFTFDCSVNVCEFDGSSSSDSDGSIVAYAWDFGDGATATGSSATHSFATGGIYTVTLTVTDDRGDTDSVQIEVTVADPPNVAPTASASGACVLLDCTVNGSASVDSDGSIVSYDWDFGDGATGTGANASHTYATGGTYTVTLTVTDDDGATDTTTVDVEAIDPGVAAGFRAAASANTSTANANITVPAAVQAGDQLLFIVTANSNTTATTPAGWTLLGTRQDGTPDMTSWVFTRTAVAGTGGSVVAATLGASSKVSRVLVAYSNATVPTVATSSVMGSSSTALTTPSAPVPYTGSAVVSYWADKSGSNGGWTLPLGVAQRAASIGAGSGRITAAVADSFPAVGTWPGATANSGVAGTKGIGWTIVMAPATGNNAPVASFGSACTLLSCSFDASASSDSDGSIVSYDWDFGDGATDTGATPAHVYAADGTYAVTLTVTDDDGAQSTTSANVSVSLAAVQFRAAASSNLTSAAPPITVPATVQSGDQLLLFVTTNSATTAATPAGWTSLGSVTAGSPDERSSVFTRTADAGTAGSSVVTTLGASAKVSVVLLAYGNAGPITTAASAVSEVSSTSMTSPAVTVAAPGARVVSYWVDKTGANTGWTLPGSVTERATSIGSGSGRVTAAAGDSSTAAGTWPGVTAVSTANGAKQIAWSIVVPAP